MCGEGEQGDWAVGVRGRAWVRTELLRDSTWQMPGRR